MTATSPLIWPAHLPRTARRSPARFTTTGPQAYKQLVDEVRRMGGRNLIVSTNLPVTRGGLMNFGVRKSAITDPGVSIWFDRQGQELVLACDRWTTVEDNMRALGNTLEALRGIERWGTQEMQEAAYQGYAALPARSEAPWWDVLEVAPTASRSEIDAAYREALKRHHPDTGGDTEAFLRVQEAYRVATTPPAIAS